MTYIAKQIEDTYVVWFAPANRYMQLQKPAFRVLEDWTNRLSTDQIIRNCAHEFQLRVGEARRFVLEITTQLQSLSKPGEDAMIRKCNGRFQEPDADSFVVRNYRINGKNYQFRYGHPDLEELIHPAFGYLEKMDTPSGADSSFQLFYSSDQIILQLDGRTCWTCPSSETDRYIGLVFMQFLNCIHHTTDAHWMGAVHASAVSAGNGAVLFTAPSGSGKSTFAAMLMHRGYQVLSDDFSPVSLIQPKVYPFPEGISVKNRSLKVLQDYFPDLLSIGDSLPKDIYEVFLPVTKGELSAPEPVKALVFVQYNPEVELEFEKIPNLEAMDRFLQQLWLPPTNEVASRFMDWFFQVPCYTLQYSNTIKAIESVSELFKAGIG